MRKVFTFLLLGASVACADNIVVSSVGTDLDPWEYSGAGEDYVIAPHPDWAQPFNGSKWVSNNITGNPYDPGYQVYPNGTTISFFKLFTLADPVSQAVLNVMSDDSTTVVVNGVEIATGYPTGNQNGFSTNDAGHYDISQYLTQGTNTLKFDVTQWDLASFGLDYRVNIVTDPNVSGVPEPATWVLLGSSLLALGFWRRKGGERA